MILLLFVMIIAQSEFYARSRHQACGDLDVDPVEGRESSQRSRASHLFSEHVCSSSDRTSQPAIISISVIRSRGSKHQREEIFIKASADHLAIPALRDDERRHGLLSIETMG
jgi:hypothetical protein